MQCVTGPLTPTQLLDEIPEIAKSLLASGIEDLVVEYGRGCKLETDQLWKDIAIRAPDLVAFVRNSIDKGIYSPGEADLVLHDREGSFQCILCHECDIHLLTGDDGILTEATQRWMNKGYGGFKLAAGEDWEPI